MFSDPDVIQFMIDEDILSYTWSVNTATGEISSGNQGAKRILDIVNYYDWSDDSISLTRSKHFSASSFFPSSSSIVPLLYNASASLGSIFKTLS